MQRFLSLKQLSKIPQNISNCNSISLQNSTFLYNTYPIYLHTCRIHHHHFFSQNNSFSQNINGFLSNPILLNQLFKSIISKDPSQSFIDHGVGFLIAQFRRVNFQYNSSFASYRRGWQSWHQRLTTNGVVLGLILTNVAVFLLWRIADRNFMMKNFTISVDNFKSLRVHTMITSAFSHVEAWHLISNMIGLYFFGMSIGNVFGPEFLLKLYLSGAVVGSVFYLVHHTFIAPSRNPGLGASGAVNAIMLLQIFLFPKNIIYVEFIIPVPAILLGIFLIGKDLLRIFEGDRKISGAAHLGGAAVAVIAWAQIRRGRRPF